MKAIVDHTEESRLYRQNKIQLKRRQKARLAQMTEVALSPPAVGSMSVIGKRPSMEDEVSIHPNLCAPPRPLHFYAIYDGHGGPQVNLLLFFYYEDYNSGMRASKTIS